MKLFVGVATNNMASYGGAQTLRHVVLFVFVPDRTAMYDANGYVTGVN